VSQSSKGEKKNKEKKESSKGIKLRRSKKGRRKKRAPKIFLFCQFDTGKRESAGCRG
jgi:hypothetical protein